MTLREASMEVMRRRYPASSESGHAAAAALSDALYPNGAKESMLEIPLGKESQVIDLLAAGNAQEAFELVATSRN